MVIEQFEHPFSPDVPGGAQGFPANWTGARSHSLDAGPAEDVPTAECSAELAGGQVQTDAALQFKLQHLTQSQHDKKCLEVCVSGEKLAVKSCSCRWVTCDYFIGDGISKFPTTSCHY